MDKQTFNRIAVEYFGPVAWQEPLAKYLGVSKRHVFKLKAGHVPISGPIEKLMRMLDPVTDRDKMFPEKIDAMD